MIVSPSADYVFAESDIMAVLGTNAQVRQLMEWLA
jgi:K+/H+ antiporter YhaU regulatory subunit KhtT